MELFGFTITKAKSAATTIPAVVAPSSNDGSTVVGGNAAAYYSEVLNLDASLKNENDLIKRYRDAAMYPDCDSAIEEIVSDAVISDEEKQSVDINLERLKISAGIKNKIRDEFNQIYRLYKFDKKGHDIFRNWYIDGRLYYYVIIDPKNQKDGIKELRYIDPQKIRKVKKVTKKKNDKGVDVVTNVEEYYLFNDKGVTNTSSPGIKLSMDSVICSDSGLVDGATGVILSHLHKAVKPTNQLSMMENALVIYRITRAPERRIFYIDVGNLPKQKAEQYVTDIMNKYRNKIVYDATTGEVKNDKKHMSMMEDFWMPRREGGKGTEITTLQGGQNLSSIEDIQYFQQKLFQSLNVPIGRLQPSSGFSLGKTSEITREEVKFSKFIGRLRSRFSNIFAAALRVQLIAKGIISNEDWEEISNEIRFDFRRDNHFTEMKEAEIIQTRLANLQMIDPFVGKYYSLNWVKKNVLFQSEEEMEQMDKENEEDPVLMAQADTSAATTTAPSESDPDRGP